MAMKAEGKVIPEAEIRKEAEGKNQEGVMERLIQEDPVKEHEEVDEAVAEVAEKTGEEEQREEGNTIHEADLKEEDIVNQDTGLEEGRLIQQNDVKENEEVREEENDTHG